VVDRSDIADLNAFDLLDTEAERVAGHLSSLDEKGWAANTRCAGWRAREMLSHLAGVETYHLACLNDSIGALFEEAAKDGVTDVHSFNDWAVRTRTDRSREEVLDEWRTKNQEVRRRLRELGPDGTLSSSVGPYPADLMAFHVASEYATHADDMLIAIPGAERAERNAWRAKVSRFALKENEKPVSLEQRGDTYVARSGDKEIELKEDDFVEAVTARLPDDFPIDKSLREALVALA
jgi:uncharacterized protein (TIGR03083 family)